MPSKSLMSCWWGFNILLLAAGTGTLVAAIFGRRPDILRNMVFDDFDLTLSFVLGGVFIGIWILSVGAVIQKNHITKGLVYLNWVLIFAMLYVLTFASILWFDTLDEFANFREAFVNESPAARIFIQDKFQCCGFWNNQDLVEIGGSFCSNATFVAQTVSLCSTPIAKKADSILNPIFTLIYGLVGIVGSFFLLTLCVINERLTEERFKKIDSKRGGRGFV